METRYIILGIGAAGSAAALLYTRLRSSLGSSSYLTMAEPLEPVSVSPGEASAHKAAYPILSQAISEVQGSPATPPQILYAGGVGFLETNFGHGWSQPGMANCHNWGAVSCNPDKMGPSACTPGLTDHDSGGKAYTTGFRCYATDLEGAKDMVKNILDPKVRPRTSEALREKNPSAMKASYAMRREHYYGGICRAAVAKFGQDLAAQSFAKPDLNEATRACAEETIRLHAHTVMRNAQAMAQSVGIPMTLRLGDYGEADKWWRGKEV